LNTTALDLSAIETGLPLPCYIIDESERSSTLSSECTGPNGELYLQ